MYSLYKNDRIMNDHGFVKTTNSKQLWIYQKYIKNGVITIQFSCDRTFYPSVTMTKLENGEICPVKFNINEMKAINKTFILYTKAIHDIAIKEAYYDTGI